MGRRIGCLEDEGDYEGLIWMDVNALRVEEVEWTVGSGTGWFGSEDGLLGRHLERGGVCWSRCICVEACSEVLSCAR